MKFLFFRVPKSRKTSVPITITRFVLPGEIWPPVAVGILTLIPGLLGLASGTPLLFPSLAPTAAIQATHPTLPASRFYNVVVGHLIGIVAALACVFLLGVSGEPSVLFAHKPSAGRFLASALAGALTQFGQMRLKALHPPALATALLITLGGFKPTIADIGILVMGILIMATAGRTLQRLQPTSANPT
jgi:hypothetical protein